MRREPVLDCVHNGLCAVAQSGLEKMLLTCVFTVAALIDKRSATSRLLRPAVISQDVDFALRQSSGKN
jgi:hypothetical protein